MCAGTGAGALVGGSLLAACEGDASPRDALAGRVLAELAEFTGWLAEYDVEGYVGEVGWPGGVDARLWNGLAEQWYGAADEAGLWVTNWAASEWWDRSYPLASYRAPHGGGAVSVPGSQARVIEAHPSTDAYLRGVNSAGGAFGAPSVEPTGTFSNANPGVAGQDYHFDSPASFGYLARRGIRLVRIECRWERLQPALEGPLDLPELGRLREAIIGARDAQLRVVLDLHNYGGYYIADDEGGVRRTVGSPELSGDLLAGLWERLATALADEPAVIAWGIMNEPAEQPLGARPAARIWESACRRAVEAIRAVGDDRLVMVPGYAYSGAQGWRRHHPEPWIQDPAGRLRYEAHHYWDAEHSSLYRRSYAAERSLSRRT